WRGKQTMNIMTRLQNHDRLVDAVILVCLEMLGPALLDKFDHPAGVKIDAKADSSSILGQVFHRQAQAPGTGGPDHQPVRSFGKVLVGERCAEDLIIDAKVVECDTRLGNTG